MTTVLHTTYPTGYADQFVEYLKRNVLERSNLWQEMDYPWQSFENGRKFSGNHLKTSISVTKYVIHRGLK